MITFKNHIQKTIWLVVLILISGCASQPAIHVEPLPQYDALFERKEGWTGGDGVYSVPLSGSTDKIVARHAPNPWAPGRIRWFYTAARRRAGGKI